MGGIYWSLVIVWLNFPTTMLSEMPYFEEFQILFFMWLQNPQAENGYLIWSKCVELASKGVQLAFGCEHRVDTIKSEDISQKQKLTLSEEQKTQMQRKLENICASHEMKIEAEVCKSEDIRDGSRKRELTLTEEQKMQMQRTLENICRRQGIKIEAEVGEVGLVHEQNMSQKATTDRKEEAPRTFRNLTPAERRRFHIYCSRHPDWRDKIERRARYVIEKVKSNGQPSTVAHL